MNDKFILLNKEKAFLIYYEQYVLLTFPKNETSIKIKLSDEIYKLIENTIRVNVNKGNIRNKYINETKVNVMMIDFYLSTVYAKQIIIKKRFLSCIRALTEIRNIIYSLDNQNEVKETSL